jgi:hypothetical protein
MLKVELRAAVSDSTVEAFYRRGMLERQNSALQDALSMNTLKAMSC